MKTGVFAGLITLDCIYQTSKALAPNEKQVAEAMLLAAGGPATNAAIAFQALGGRAILVGALGCHPLATIIRGDLAHQGLELVDLMPEAPAPPPFSSIVVNVATGDRAVISRNAVDRPMPQMPPPKDLLTKADCLLIDGHQMTLGRQLAQTAQAAHIPVVIDAGSWKTGFAEVLSLANVVIASANFCPPKGGVEAAAIAYLQSLGVPKIAVTRGAQSVLYQTGSGIEELPVPPIQAVDTLGAGDIFHGAFCLNYVSQGAFLPALQAAAAIAARACQSFGTRTWIQRLSE